MTTTTAKTRRINPRTPCLAAAAFALLLAAPLGGCALPVADSEQETADEAPPELGAAQGDLGVDADDLPTTAPASELEPREDARQDSHPRPFDDERVAVPAVGMDRQPSAPRDGDDLEVDGVDDGLASEQPLHPSVPVTR